uniref:Uncharacterized protein MANES_08G030500 n=1 Tax=Rhizophora mucronata TaxID=61149 RepID=A0A2P2JPA7_RHIMU
MGNAQSPPADPRFVSATRSFTQKEVEDLESLFVSLANQSQIHGHYISCSVFQQYFGIKGPLGERLFDLVSQQRQDGKLTFKDLVIAKSTYEKGSNDEIEEFIYQLVDVTGDGIVGRSDLESVTVSILESVFSEEYSETGSSLHREVVDVFLNAATFSKDVHRAAEKFMSFEEFKTWCALVLSARKFLGSLLVPPDAGFQSFFVH